MKQALLFILLFYEIALAQNSRYDNVAQGPKGPIPNATIAVCTQPANTTTRPCSPLASLCSSLSDTTCTSPNPVMADSLGNFSFYVKGGQVPFTVQIYGPQVAAPYLMTDQGRVNATLLNSGTIPPSATIVGTNASSQIVNASSAMLSNNTTGNAATANALAAVPTQCSGVNFAQGIAASGNANCAQPSNVTGNAATATALASTPTQCGGGSSFAVGIAASGNANCQNVTVVPSFNAPQRVTLGSNNSLTANIQTIVLTESVTFPSASGTYRADVHYGAWITAGANACAAEVIDTTNSRAWAISGQNSNGSGYIALSGSEISPQTYAASATATFTLQIICNAATTVTVNSGLFTLSPAEPTYLSVTPVLSN